MSDQSEPGTSFEEVLEFLLTRADNGKSPRLEECLARYPQFADELRKFFDDMSFVDDRLCADKSADSGTSTGLWADDDGSGQPSPTGQDEPPQLPQLKRFLVIEELGSGSQGVVYKAQQRGTKRIVALKIIREGAFASKSSRRRFEREVELASRLNHPNVVGVYECGQDSGRDYFAMEWVDGDPLDIHVGACTLGLTETLKLFTQLCSAVEFAHRHGVIHRDLKPSNVLIDRHGNPRIVDFGLAKAISPVKSDSHAGQTQPGEFAGTWYYASPEQTLRRTDSVDTRTDVYALGVLLYELLTDCRPYPVIGESTDTVARHILETPPAPPSSIRPEIDNDLETIILKALHKDPDRRYQSATSLQDDVGRFLAGKAIEAKRDHAPYVAKMFIKRHRFRFAVASAVLLTLVAFSVTVTVLYTQALSAKATTELRTEVIRDARSYLSSKLDELHWARNRLDSIAHAHPELPEVRELRKKEYPQAVALFDQITKEMPDGLLDTVMSTLGATNDVADEWLRSHEGDLAEVVELSKSHRFVFGVRFVRDTDLPFAEQPEAFAPTQSICDALVARGLRAFQRKDYATLTASFSGARSVSLGLANGRLLHQKATSVLIRSRIYDGVLAVLHDSDRTDQTLTPFIEWVVADPPIVPYRLGLISDRQAIYQLIGEAAARRSSDEVGYLDLEKLDWLTGGKFESLGQLASEHPAQARTLTPRQAIDAVDKYLNQVERWDDLTLGELDSHAAQATVALRGHTAGLIVRYLLSNDRIGFRYRCTIKARRAATILAAELLRYRLRFRHWPASLGNLVRQNAAVDSVDPSNGVRFGYRLLGESPLLYSVNEDGVDNNGLSGKWGEEGTDIVFFSIGRGD